MKIESIAIQNFLGLYDLRHTLAARTLLVCGPNGAGKSSLLDAIRFAITGNMPRGLSARGEQRRAAITEGASTGYAEVTADGYTARRAIASGTLTGDGLPAYTGLDVALDPQRFAAMPDDARRRLLFELMDVKADRETVTRVMKDEDVPDAIIERAFVLLRGGFDAAVSEANTQASEARGAWKAITGEAYGTQKAAKWRPTLETEAPSDEDLAKAERLVAAANDRVSYLMDLAGRVRAALPPERLADLQAQADDLAAATEDEQRAEREAQQAAEALAELTARARAPETLTCPCCSASLAFEDRALVESSGAAAIARPTEEELQAAKRQDHAARQALAEARGRITAAAGAARSLETAPTVTQEQRDEAATLEEARHVLGLHQAAHASLLQARTLHEQADMLANKALAAHQEVLGWLKVKELCAPSGIPAILIARALDPFNSMARAYAADAGFAPAQVERDLSLTYAGRPYALCSESEQWRADALFALVVARLSGAKAVLLDRFDVLQPDDRGRVLDWLSDPSGSMMDTVILAGTLSKRPEADMLLDVLWMGDAPVMQKAVA